MVYVLNLDWDLWVKTGMTNVLFCMEPTSYTLDAILGRAYVPAALFKFISSWVHVGSMVITTGK